MRTSARDCVSGSARDAAEHCHVIYGGSVKPDNIRELIGSLTSTAHSWAARVSTSRASPSIVARSRRCYGIIDVSGPTGMILYYLLSTVYVLICFLLLVVILLQQGKGDMAAAFGGGGSQSAFGARAGATLLSKATAVLAGLFMLGALTLAIVGQRGSSGSIMGGTQAPAPPPAAPASSTAPTSAPRTPAPTGSAPQTPAQQPPATPPQQPK